MHLTILISWMRLLNPGFIPKVIVKAAETGAIVNFVTVSVPRKYLKTVDSIDLKFY